MKNALHPKKGGLEPQTTIFYFTFYSVLITTIKKQAGKIDNN